MFRILILCLILTTFVNVCSAVNLSSETYGNSKYSFSIKLLQGFDIVEPDMEMVDKDAVGGTDIIYCAVEYVAKNFREEIFLDKMALDLGVSKYVLSRLFAKTFHCNFNKYVNGVRLNYAISALENTKESITAICLDAGFESQRTFNRVFKERYKMTPREYRMKLHGVKNKQRVG